MEKKQYIQPEIELVCPETEDLMISASPGVGGGYNHSLPINAKQGDFFDDEEEDEEEEDEGVGQSKSIWE